jgi:thiamine pyrophosphate-dependent acetolactate synthase large subunit-like protein
VSRPQPARQPVHTAIAEALHRLGVRQAFGLLGSGNFELVRHLVEERGAAWHWARQETGAVAMADAWARVTGEVGVVSVHQGPGFTNTVTGLAESVRGRTPLLVITGEVATTARGVPQQLDQDAVARSVGAGFERVTAASKAVGDVSRAYRRASAELRPVVLSVPIDVQLEQCEVEDPAAYLPAVPPPARPSAQAVSGVADLIAAAKRPLVLGGRGAVRAKAREPLEALAERAGALLATSAPANGLFAGNPYSVGISGGFASPVARRLVPQSDLLLAFGASVNRWTTRTGNMITPEMPVVQCDADRAAIGVRRPVVASLVGDAAESATALVEELDARGVKLDGFRAEVKPEELVGGGWEERDRSGPEGLDPEALIRALDPLLPEQRTLAADGGHFMGWPAMHLSASDAEGFVFNQGFQAVGLGIAAGAGAAVALPDRVCVTVVGDGGAMMSLGELDTAISHRLPMLIVVMDDAAYGAEVHHFGPSGDSTELVKFGRRDFAAVAAALGASALTIRELSDLDDDRLAAWLASPDGPLLLDCKIDPTICAEWIEEAFKGGA